MIQRRSIALLSLQIASAVVGLPALALWPPASGGMTIVPIDGADVNHTLVRALAGGARVVGGGVVRGSLVVVGDRAAIARQFAPRSVLMLAPMPAGCGLAPGAAA